MRTDRYKESPVPGAQALRLTALAAVLTPPRGMHLPSGLDAPPRPAAEVPLPVLVAERFAAGEPAALALAYERYAALVHGYAVRALGAGPTAELVVERVFITAWAQRHTFDPAQNSFGTWLVGLTRRDLTWTLVRLVPVSTRSASAQASLALSRVDAAPLASVTPIRTGRFTRLRSAFGAVRAA
ncbi:sigma factor [Spongisporangium articulatum]|uniref:Sigma factor n=1 Tax=Spongisporangium articulatum TaxID=3362603 RepID=A0ABW8ARI5_9ACTN